MIRPKNEYLKDKNGKIFIRKHFIGAGKHGFDATENGESDWWVDLDGEGNELRESRNCDDYFLHHGHYTQHLELKEKDTET